MRFLATYFSALIFGLGLGVSGMTNPSKVKGFLDIFGQWQPALIFVMGGAVLFHGLSYYFIRRRSSPLFGEKFLVPTKKIIDTRLVSGSILFGIGWGLGGYCPGPALASLFLLNSSVLTFIASMLVGMVLFFVTVKRP